jgi:hypothetical protein
MSVQIGEEEAFMCVSHAIARAEEEEERRPRERKMRGSLKHHCSRMAA